MDYGCTVDLKQISMKDKVPHRKYEGVINTFKKYVLFSK